MSGTDILNPKNKKFWLLLLLFFLGVMLILLGSCDNKQAPSGTEKDPVENNAGQVMENGLDNPSVMTRQEKELAAELREMLERVSGAGRVEVKVQLATSTHKDYAINTNSGLKTTQENDQDGGSREITENTDARTVVITRGSQGLEEPVVEREVAPEVTGVLVVAEGAKSPRVKASLFRAVQVALGVEPQNIIVLPMKEGDE